MEGVSGTWRPRLGGQRALAERLPLELPLGPTMPGVLLAEEGTEFEEAINQQAKPEVDHGP